MALRQCRWCEVSVNGEGAIADHERRAHPKLYWEAKAVTCKAQAKRLMNEADRYEQRAKADSTLTTEYLNL